jgi:hypothetical protein
VFAFRANLSICKATEKEVRFKHDDKMLKNLLYKLHLNLENADKKLLSSKSGLALVVNSATARILTVTE